MAYILNEFTFRTNNPDDGMKRIDEVWRDIASGKLPILFDSEHTFKQRILPCCTKQNKTHHTVII